VYMLKRRYSGAVIFMAAAIVSAMAHGFAVSLLIPSRSGDLGSVDVATNAISINLETTDVLDATESAAAREAASSNPVSAAAQGVKHAEEKPEEVEEKKAATSADALTKQEEEKEQPEQVEEKKREKAQQASAEGGAGMVGAENAQASAGRVSASQGSVLNYGAKLRAMISSNTPKNIRKTSIRIAFGIAPTGGLMTASIVASSGDPGVDKRMIKLIRDLAPRFPLPPDGASAAQLAYNIEIIFQ
jgi:periplasmic protein TonB